MICKSHSWYYESISIRSCKKCGLVQHHIWKTIRTESNFMVTGHEKSRTCKVCNEIFESKSLMKEHIDEVHRV